MEPGRVRGWWMTLGLSLFLALGCRGGEDRADQVYSMTSEDLGGLLGQGFTVDQAVGMHRAMIGSMCSTNGDPAQCARRDRLERAIRCGLPVRMPSSAYYVIREVPGQNRISLRAIASPDAAPPSSDPECQR